jgi:hypothetical protein
MTGLAVILGIICVVAALLTLGMRWTRTVHYRGQLVREDVDVDRTIIAKLVCGVVALLAGYGAGYFAGWWT